MLLRNLVPVGNVADPVNFFRIQIRLRGSGFKNPDPDLGNPKKTGSDRIRIRIHRYVFDVQQTKEKLCHFYTKSKHLMTLKIKDKKLY